MTLRILGIGEGDEVIVPAYTYTASASIICHVGAKPVIVDCAKGKLHLDAEALANAVTEKTKAVIPVDVGGVMCDYDSIFEALEAKKSLFKPKNKIQEGFGRIIVLADGAHSFGAEYKTQKSGGVADFTAFSFHAVKISLPQRAVLLHGVTEILLIMMSFISNICSYPCMVRIKMLSQKQELVLGNMT